MTLRKRISLAAVSALTAGLLTVVAPQSAYAALGNAENVAANATGGAAGATTSDTSSASVGSVGLLQQTGENTTQTAVLLSTGTIAIPFAASGTTTTSIASITGGRFTAITGTGGVISGTSSTSANSGSTTNTALGLLAVPNSGSTRMVIELSYETVATPAVATLQKRITVTVVATSAFNEYAPTFSWARWGAGDGTETAVTDVTTTNHTTDSALTLSGSVALLDAYGNAVSSANTGLLTATVTAGAKVNLGHATTAGTTTFDSNAATGATIPFNIQQVDSTIPWNGTVTFSFNGTVIATKTGVIKGEVTKVTLGSPKIGTIGSNTGAATIAYEDAKGNAVYPTTGTSAVSASLSAVVTSLSVGTYPTSSVTGLVTQVCSVSGSATGLQMSHLNTSGTTVLSNKWDSGCSAAPYTVTGSWDKASYTPGSIATLTLSYKDIFGNKSNAYDSISVSAANTTMTITGAPSATPVTAIGNDKPSGVTGEKTYQFVVGSTEGDFVAVVVPTEVVENNPTGQKNLSLPYSVKAGTATVSNADVLKSIVALIASINKQIQALQKLILKR